MAYAPAPFGSEESFEERVEALNDFGPGAHHYEYNTFVTMVQSNSPAQMSE